MIWQNLIDIYSKYQAISAEMIIFLTIVLNFIGFFFMKSENKAATISIMSVIGLSFAVCFLPQNFDNLDSTLLFNEMYLINKNNSIVKIVVIIATILAHLAIVFMPKKDNGIHKLSNFELPLLINFSLLGILFAISSNNFLVLYLSLELQALPGYILAAIKRDSSYSLEGGVKYFVLGVFASSIFLYGVSLIYISLGSLSYEIIADLLMQRSTEFSILLLIGMIFVMFGLLFKLAAAPLHNWISDVYQSVHGTVLTFFSVAPKLGVAYVIYILYHFVFVGKYFFYNTSLISIFIFFSFFIGAIGAIKQTNFKRLLAYSAIANSGFLLLNILGDLSYSFSGLIIYSFSYMIASYGLISFVMYYWDELKDKENYLISDLSGLAKNKPYLAASVAALLFSVAGIPPFIGFLGKVYVLMASISALHLTLSILALITSVVSLIYYLGIIKAMYFNSSLSLLKPLNLCRYGVLTICYAALSVVTICFFNYFISFLV